MMNSPIALRRFAAILMLLGISAAQTAPPVTLSKVTLPTTEGATLADQRLVLADAVKGKAALLIITFSRSAGDNASQWRKELRQKNLPGPQYTLYQVAELEDVPRFIRWTVVSGMRRGLPAAEHPTFVILTKDTELWKKFVSFQKEDDPYLVVIDAAGNIKTRIAGEKTAALMDQLEKALK